MQANSRTGGEPPGRARRSARSVVSEDRIFRRRWLLEQLQRDAQLIVY